MVLEYMDTSTTSVTRDFVIWRRLYIAYTITRKKSKMKLNLETKAIDMEYKPDNWVIIEIPKEEKTYSKVLAGWSGGYLDGDYWRVNSGITEVEEKEDHYLFHGQSGSVYGCWKDLEKIRGNILGPLRAIDASDSAKVVKYNDIKDNLKQR